MLTNDHMQEQPEYSWHTRDNPSLGGCGAGVVVIFSFVSVFVFLKQSLM